jgi:2-methylcitrate dehydratase PrpD
MNPIDFIHNLTWDDLPKDVQNQARRCLLDTLGAAIAGKKTELSRIIHDFVAANYHGGESPLWGDGRLVSPPGAALANGMSIDALDIHDGFSLAKGHAGAAVIPAALATLSLDEAGKVSGKELLTTLVVGYEVALRAGVALHATACDYHTSGAWNALGCAAITTRRLGSTREATGHALGIAEYHGPRSQMMRVIDHPSMLKDGSGWGCMAGVSAALLAQHGFTGAPAQTVEGVDVQRVWEDIGANWLILQQYFKPHAVCRWAQPAVAAALALKHEANLHPEQIQRIRIFTFHEAIQLCCRYPETTEQAQYSLLFPVAAAIVYGRLGPEELSGDGLKNPAVLRLVERIETEEDATYSELFPSQRFARVNIETTQGETLFSNETQAGWEASKPPSDEELQQKFRWLTRGNLPEPRVSDIEAIIWNLEKQPDATRLVELLAAPFQ